MAQLAIARIAGRTAVAGEALERFGGHARRASEQADRFGNSVRGMGEQVRRAATFMHPFNEHFRSFTDIQKFGTEIGASARQIQGLEQAANLAAADMNVLAAAVDRLNKLQGQAEQDADIADMLAEAGLLNVDLRDLTTTTERLRQALAGMGDAQRRFALMQIFGDVGTIRSLNEELSKLPKTIENTGPSKEQVQAAERWYGTITEGTKSLLNNADRLRRVTKDIVDPLNFSQLLDLGTNFLQLNTQIDNSLSRQADSRERSADAAEREAEAAQQAAAGNARAQQLRRFRGVPVERPGQMNMFQNEFFNAIADNRRVADNRVDGLQNVEAAQQKQIQDVLERQLEIMEEQRRADKQKEGDQQLGEINKF